MFSQSRVLVTLTLDRYCQPRARRIQHPRLGVRLSWGMPPHAGIQAQVPLSTGRRGMIITIDGPAGTGKSTVALTVAARLGFDFLDTGAMYRAIGFEALRRNCNLEDQRELAFIARHARIEFDWSRHPPGVILNGEPVGHMLRGGEATKAASYIAVVPAIRETLVEQQRLIGRQRGNLVTEGRDQGSVVFPDAGKKFYLDATPQERARRRVAQLRHRGELVDPQEILDQIIVRDRRDASRSVGPMVVPRDAEIVDTTRLSEDQVVDHIVTRVQSSLSAGQQAAGPRS